MTPSTTCARVREALSAQLDGEQPGLPDEALRAHLRDCPACAAWQADAVDATRRLRVQPAPPTPDLAARVAAQLPPGGLARPVGGWPVERVLLLVLGVLQVLLSLPLLLLGPETAADLHLAREVGVTEIALAVGVLAAAWQPWRAAGMLPVVVVLAVGLAVTSTLDVAAGRVDAVGEAPHLLALVDALLLALLRRRLPAPPADGVPRSRSLRVVGDDERRSA